MTTDETSALIDLIASEHPSFLEVPSPEYKIANWAESLAGVDFDTAKDAVKKALRESPFPPKLADIMARLPKSSGEDGPRRRQPVTEWEVRSQINVSRFIDKPVFPFYLREALKYPSCRALLTPEEIRIGETWMPPGSPADVLEMPLKPKTLPCADRIDREMLMVEQSGCG